MSNPGVIYLVDRSIGQHHFRIEDNIGEAIHIHFDDFRIDISIKELLNLSENCTNLLSEITGVSDSIINSFDPLFLDEICYMIPQIKEVNKEIIFLKDLLIQNNYFHMIPHYKNINESIFYKALIGDKKVLDKHYQEGIPNQTNLQRLKNIEQSIKKNGYPYNSNYIILFNNQNIIRDGQHRAAVLYKMFGNIDIPVLRIKFVNSKYSLTRTPTKDFLFNWSISRVYSTFRFVIRKSRSFIENVHKRIKYFRNNF